MTHINFIILYFAYIAGGMLGLTIVMLIMREWLVAITTAVIGLISLSIAVGIAS